MDNQTVVVFDKETKDVLACVSLTGKDSICRKDVDFQIYNGVEPIFVEIENGIKLKENTFMFGGK